MTFHWRKSEACDLDELLRDINPQMKNLEREIRDVASGSITTTSVTTDVLLLPPVTQPAADATDISIYYDSTSEEIEVVTPDDVRAILVQDVEGPTTTPSTVTIRATMSGLVQYIGADGQWTLLRDSADPADVDADPGAMQVLAGIAVASGGEFNDLARGFMVFDTSAVPEAPASGTITVVPESVNAFELNGGLAELRLFNYLRYPLDARVPEEEDYYLIRQRGAVRGSNTMPLISSLMDDVPFVFTLNVFGLSNIHRNGFSAFALRHWKDLQTLSAPTGADSEKDDVTFYGYDALLALRPLLTLNFS